MLYPVGGAGPLDDLGQSVADRLFDGKTRRQKGRQNDGQFLTDKKD